jgi:hypothetical protein
MKEEKSKKKISKKDIRQAIYDRLATALAEYKSEMKEKRFDSYLKKVSKLFADDLAKAASKKTTKLKKADKKKITPKTGRSEDKIAVV